MAKVANLMPGSSGMKEYNDLLNCEAQYKNAKKYASSLKSTMFDLSDSLYAAFQNMYGCFTNDGKTLDNGIAIKNKNRAESMVSEIEYHIIPSIDAKLAEIQRAKEELENKLKN